MRSTRHKARTDVAILDHDHDMWLLRAVAAGRVVRGAGGGETSMFAPRLLDGEQVQMHLHRLSLDGLIRLPISGPPTVEPRGQRLLQMANGEIPVATDSD